MTEFTERARIFATRAHGAIGQKRKYTRDDYIHHPAAVVAILKSYGIDDDETIAGAWLHDVVEDCPVALCEIGAFFGAPVELIVLALTDEPAVRDGPNRAIRKAISRERLSRGDARVHNIKVADILDNTRSIVAYDPDFAKVYMAEISILLPILYRANSGLWMSAAAQISDYYDERKAA